MDDAHRFQREIERLSDAHRRTTPDNWDHFLDLVDQTILPRRLTFLDQKGEILVVATIAHRRLLKLHERSETDPNTDRTAPPPGLPTAPDENVVNRLREKIRAIDGPLQVQIARAPSGDSASQFADSSTSNTGHLSANLVPLRQYANSVERLESALSNSMMEPVGGDNRHLLTRIEHLIALVEEQSDDGDETHRDRVAAVRFMGAQGEKVLLHAQCATQSATALTDRRTSQPYFEQ